MNACRCGPKFIKGDRAPWPKDWPRLDDVDRTVEVWVCANCGKPAFAVPEETFVLRGPADAQHLFSAEGNFDGTSLLFWQTPRGRIATLEYKPYPRKPKMPNPEVPQEPILYQLWTLLDSKVDVILKPVEGAGDNTLQAEARKQAQNEARGIAEALAVIMYPFMDDANAIVKAAVKRHAARNGGEPFEVPGLGEHMFNPSFNHDGSPRVQVASPKTQTRTAVKPKVNNQSQVKLSAEEASAIREAASTGMFSNEDLASMFKVSLATLEAALKPA